MGAFGRFLFGGAGTKASAGEATAGQAATPEQLAQATQGASGYMQGYDAATAADTAGGAAATMKRAQEAARGTAAAQSDQSVAQAAKAARTSGMMPGQAALAGSAQAANAYGSGMQSGTEQFNQNVTRQAQLGESMSGRLQSAAQTQAQLNAANAAAQTQASIANATGQTQASIANQQQQGQMGPIAGAISSVGSLFSDRRLKESVKQKEGISDSLAKIKGYAYRYKGGDHGEAGIMAQDLEKTEAAPAVFETGQGKAIDTDRLSTINTAAIGELGRRTKDIERMINELKAVKHA